MNYIDGKWIEGSGESFESIDPANAEKIWSGKSSAETDVDLAVRSARAAFKNWSRLSFDKRKSYLEKFIRILESRKAEISQAISRDNGKAKWEADAEVSIMISKFSFTVKSFEERAGERKVEVNAQTRSVTRHKPHGVIAIFGPYNFPGHVPNGHIMPALLAGNTIVFKPSELVPYASELMIKIWSETGLPAGVLNLVQGKSDTGKALANHTEINGIFFTGSSKVGQILNQQLAIDTRKILALEMGGNNPLVIHDVQDLQAAAYLTIQSAFATSGQRCTCARRLILTESANREKFIQLLVDMTKSIKVGTYNEADIFMGPVISATQATKILDEQNKLIKHGAQVILESKSLKAATGLISPGIIDSTNIPINQREDFEIFGPLLQIFKVKNLDEAIVEANRTHYGLSAGIITDKSEHYEKFLNGVNAGLINWNNQITGAYGGAPFGGIGDSGNFRPSAYYAVDYSCYPVASMESPTLSMPERLSPGINII